MCEDTIEIDLDLGTVQKDGSYVEISLFDYVSDRDTLQLALNPFDVYPEERMLELSQIVEQRKCENGVSHEDWLADDLGEGYDRDDPFIDDSEAPQEILGITTRFGGFYVSKGDVEIVNENAGEDEPEDPTIPDQICPSLRCKIEAFVQYYDELVDKENVWNDQKELLKAINDGLYNLSSTLRSRILSYLSHRLKVKKAYFLKRLRRIRNPSDNKDLIDKTLSDLRLYVENNMPQQFQKWLEVRWQSGLEQGCLPKKRFHWTPDGIQILHTLVKLKLENSTNSDSSIIEGLHNFLENAVKPIWPKGWVTVSSLMKECLPLLPENAVIRKKRKLSPLATLPKTVNVFPMLPVVHCPSLKPLIVPRGTFAEIHDQRSHQFGRRESSDLSMNNKL